MRVVDLDRDMSDVIPTGTTRDSQYLFDRMTRRTLALAQAAPGRRILDVASGFGQDALALARAGATVVGAEPSRRMLGWVRLVLEREPPPHPAFVQAWSDALPFRSESFDAAICKGALDHFDRPERAIEEMARITRADGRVVLAIANFESLACRVARAADALRSRLSTDSPRRGRRHYDVPADHFTRYDHGLMREQASHALELERVEGVSLGWGLAAWTRAVEGLPAPVASAALQALGALARALPTLADVVIVAGRPRRRAARSASTSR